MARVGSMHVVAALIALYALVYGTFVWIKYHYYLYNDFDLAIFLQATDQILRGSLYSSIRGMYWLGDHVSLILFVLSPLVAIARHPLTLLFLQTVTLALGAWPVAALARRWIGHSGVAVILAALYLLHPAIGYTNLFEFHPEVLATTTLLATIACMAADRLGWTLLFAALSLMCKEDVALPVFMLGLTTLLPGRRRRYAPALCGLALLSLIVSFAVIKPRFASTAAEYGKMYRDWGATLPQVAINLLRQPLRAIAAFVFTPGDAFDTTLKRIYWPEMLGPFLFLPLLEPVTLAVALPVLAEHFLSFRPQQHGVIYQYTALVTPVFTAAAVAGLANLIRLVTRRPAPEAISTSPRARGIAIGVAGLALAASIACNLLYGPLLQRGWMPVQALPEHNTPDLRERTLRPLRDRLIARVPRQGGVVAGFEFLARLASRPNVHTLHHIYTGYYTFSDRPYPVPVGSIDAFLGDIGDSRLAAYMVPSTPLRLRRLMAGNRLHPVDAAGDLLLFERDARDTIPLITVGAPAAAHAGRVLYDRQLVFTGHDLPSTSVAPGGLLEIDTSWRRVAPADRHFMTQLVVEDEAGKPVFTVFRHLGYLFYPVAEWPPDTPVRETYRLPIPLDLAPGRYALGLRVGWWRDGPVAAMSQPDDTTLLQRRMLVDLGTFTVEAGAPRP